MRETTFQRELSDGFRAASYWVRKWPDTPPGRMGDGRNGALRFLLPKPCDLVGCSPSGRFLAVECKLVRGGTWRPDGRAARQLATLRDLTAMGALAFLALNFRWLSKRQGQMNRAFLLTPGPLLTEPGLAWRPVDFAADELQRVTGGWDVAGYLGQRPHYVSSTDPVGFPWFSG